MFTIKSFFFFWKKLPSNYCCCISLFCKTDAMDASDIEPWNRLPFPVQDWRITFPMVRDCIYCVINSLFRHTNCNASNFSNWTAVLDVVSLSWWCCCHRCHIHITNQDRLVTRSSHVRTPYATHCTKTWVQPSTAHNPSNATTHSYLQMDHLLVCSSLTSSLYPWPRPPMTILTSQSGTPTQYNTSWSLHNDSFLRLATFVCGFVQM